MTITAVALAALALVQAAPATAPQDIHYTIEARLDESTDVLTARGRIEYRNQSTVALDTLWFHEHLNAFRPNSAWARREMEFDNPRFQELGARDYAYERLGRVEIDGARITPVYPGAPDSTVVAFPLPRPLEPGQSLTVDVDWAARLSTLPRRQGRRGRHYDFAQWYPRIAAFTDEGWQVQPLMPQGEFFGEFATYDVTLDVAADQVMGATGVPVAGDPGWAAAARTGTRVNLGSDAYGSVTAAALGLVAAPAAGRKVVQWRAEDVHHFAWSTDPDYVYESGTVQRAGPDGGTIDVHALYWPSDTAWVSTAVENSVEALEWLQTRFGPYPWPQFTNLHRIESGGTEFPMLIMDGSASLGLILHEGGHQFVHGILANNEFREGWMDEGFSSYMTDKYFEEHGQPEVWQPTHDGIVRLETLGRSEPVGLPGAEFSDPAIYSQMTYAKGELILRMLEYVVGADVMAEGIRHYYAENALQHVTEDDFRQAIEDVSGMDLRWFFDQWIDTTDQLDYGITAVRTRQQGDVWVTSVDIERRGSAWMPVTLRVGNVDTRLESRDRAFTVEVETPTRPTSAELDPDGYLIDVGVANDERMIR